MLQNPRPVYVVRSSPQIKSTTLNGHPMFDPRLSTSTPRPRELSTTPRNPARQDAKHLSHLVTNAGWWHSSCPVCESFVWAQSLTPSKRQPTNQPPPCPTPILPQKQPAGREDISAYVETSEPPGFCFHCSGEGSAPSNPERCRLMWLLISRDCFIGNKTFSS